MAAYDERTEEALASLLASLADPGLSGDDLVALAARSPLPLLRCHGVQDALYSHPSSSFLVAIELTLHVGTTYYQDNSGPIDLARMRAAAPEHLRLALTVAWNYPWQERWGLRVLREVQGHLAGPAREVFVTLVADAAAESLPATREELRRWALEAAAVAECLHAGPS